MHHLRATLAPFPLFAWLEEEDFDELARAIAPRRLAAGEVLFREGEPGDAAYVEVGGRKIRLAMIGPGALVGELALLDRGRRSATVRATRASWVLLLLRSDFERVFRARSHFAYALLDTVVDGLAERLRRSTRQLAEIAADPDHDPAGRRLQAAADSVIAAIATHPGVPGTALDLTAIEVG